ncbi:MAG: hypothetical protein RR614_05565 [Eubacterium sp.]
MKKIITLLLTAALIFYTVSSPVLAFGITDIPISSYISSPESTEPTDPPEPTGPTDPPEPSTSVPDPDPVVPPTTKPEPPKPDPPASTPDNSGNDYNYDDEDDDYVPYDQNNTQNYRPTPTPETGTVKQTVDETVKEVQEVQGDYPVTLTVKDTVIDVALTDKAYTVSQKDKDTFVDFNKDALNNAITTANAKLAEMKKNGSGNLTTIVVKVPSIDIKNTTDPNITLQIPGISFKSLTSKTVFLDIPIKNASLHINSSNLRTEELKNLADDDKLIIDIKKGASPKDSTYKISDTVLTPAASPLSLSVSTLKTTGAKSSINFFETPMEMTIPLSDDEAAKLQNTDTDQFIACKYNSNNNTIDVMTTVYHADTKNAVFFATTPGEYMVMLKTIDKGLNPLVIIVPLIIIALGAGGFAFYKFKNRGPRNIFGDYDD